MAYRLIYNDEQVSYTTYKPKIGDIIKIDETREFYKVKEIIGNNAYCSYVRRMSD